MAAFQPTGQGKSASAPYDVTFLQHYPSDLHRREVPQMFSASTCFTGV